MLYSSVAVLALGLFGCTGFRFRVPPPIKFDFFPICCALLLFLFVLLVCYSVFVCVFVLEEPKRGPECLNCKSEALIPNLQSEAPNSASLRRCNKHGVSASSCAKGTARDASVARASDRAACYNRNTGMCIQLGQKDLRVTGAVKSVRSISKSY